MNNYQNQGYIGNIGVGMNNPLPVYSIGTGYGVSPPLPPHLYGHGAGNMKYGPACGTAGKYLHGNWRRSRSRSRSWSPPHRSGYGHRHY